MQSDKTTDTDSERNIKKATTMAVIAVILIFLAFSAMAGAVFMLDMGMPERVIVPIALILFLGGNITGVVLIVKAYPALLASDCMKMDQAYDQREPVKLSISQPDVPAQRLQECRFKCTQDGYYRKKKFSFMKDVVHYYVRITEDHSIENALRREPERFVGTRKKRETVCLLLFVYMDEVGERERNEIKELGKNRIVVETILMPTVPVSVVVVAVDRGTDCGYFMDVRKRNGISLYSYGCRMLKKICA